MTQWNVYAVHQFHCKLHHTNAHFHEDHFLNLKRQIQQFYLHRGIRRHSMDYAHAFPLPINFVVSIFSCQRKKWLIFQVFNIKPVFSYSISLFHQHRKLFPRFYFDGANETVWKQKLHLSKFTFDTSLHSIQTKKRGKNIFENKSYRVIKFHLLKL